jgi:hypothetical protein
MAGTTSGVSISKNGDDIDIVLYQGKTINFEVIWGGETPINVTGFTARMHAREAASSTAILAEFTNANGRISVGGANGKFTISMSAADSAALKPCVGIYDFEIISASGAVYLVMSGKFQIEAEVTK